MKIFMTFSALILCFVIHDVLAERQIPSTCLVLDKCFQNFYSYNCLEGFEKVISTVSNKWCCIKFIYNEKNDDEALQNNVMTSSGNGNENMTTNIMISREAYDDSSSITTDDVSIDTKQVDSVEKIPNSMLDETDSINMNGAIDDSSLPFIEKSIDSQLNGATNDKDDDAEFMQQVGENFENIESNSNANEIENEFETRVKNSNGFEASIENEGFNDDAEASDEFGNYNEVDVDLDQRLKTDLYQDVDAGEPQITIDQLKGKFSGSDVDDEGIEVNNLEVVDQSINLQDPEDPIKSYDQINPKLNTDNSEDDVDVDLSTSKKESINSNENQSEDQDYADLDNGIEINNQLDESTGNENSIKLSKSVDSSDLNQENESSENESLLESNDENSEDINIEIQEKAELNEKQNQIDENSISEITNQNSNEDFEELQDPEDSSGDSEENSEVATTPPSIPEPTTKNSFLPGSRRQSKLNEFRKFKANQPSFIKKSPRKSFKQQFTSKLSQRSLRLSPKKKQSSISLGTNIFNKPLPIDSDKSIKSPAVEANENFQEISNDDDSKEIQEQQHDNVESRRHEDVINVNSEEMSHVDDTENENSLNNPKSLDIDNENVNSDIEITDEDDTEVEMSRQQQISKLSQQSSDSNDSLQSDNLVDNGSNQVEDSVTVEVKNDNNELQFENSIDENVQNGDENLQLDENDSRVDDNDELENNQIEDDIDDKEGDETVMTEEKQELTIDKGSVKRRPVLINKLGERVNIKDLEDRRKSNIVEGIDSQIGNAII